VLLYDLTSTYFEADPPFAESDKRRHGYSRDHRPDCVAMCGCDPGAGQSPALRRVSQAHSG
jgi:hypothetical protein